MRGFVIRRSPGALGRVWNKGVDPTEFLIPHDTLDQFVFLIVVRSAIVPRITVELVQATHVLFVFTTAQFSLKLFF